MTKQQKNKMQKKVLYISLAILGLAVGFLILCGIKGYMNTIIFPIGIGTIMFAYWMVADVLSVVWIKEFEGKTEKQRRSYYIFAAMDLAALGGLVWFIIDMNGMTGVLVYVLFNMSKKRYKDEFLGNILKEEIEKTDAQGSEKQESEGQGSEEQESERQGSEE